MQHAQGFDVHYTETYPTLLIYTSADTTRYALMPTNTPSSASPSSGLIPIRTPVRRLVVTSTTHLGLLNCSTPATPLVGLGQADYVYDAASSPAWTSIVTQIRLPKAVTAILAGAALSVGGLQMQTLFRNPLAGPSVLGVTSGASLGVALVTMSTGSIARAYTGQALGLAGSWLIVLAATAGEAAVLLLVLWVSFRISDSVVILIVGLMIGNVTLSVVGIWQYFSQPEQIQNYVLWTLGSLNSVTPRHLPVLLTVVGGGIGLSFLLSNQLNALLLGENYARSLVLPSGNARGW